MLYKQNVSETSANGYKCVFDICHLTAGLLMLRCMLEGLTTPTCSCTAGRPSSKPARAYEASTLETQRLPAAQHVFAISRHFLS